MAVSGDIEAMYHHVKVHRKDLSVQRFIWRTPGSNAPPKTFQMTVQVFGLISSPTSCLFALQHTAKTRQFKDVENVNKSSFYVDNYIDSFESEEKAIKTVDQVTITLASCGFRLNQWISSSRPVLASIPSSERKNPNSNLTFGELPSERSLGMLWNCQADVFQFIAQQHHNVTTKRQFLAAISRIFDPLGLLCQ